MNEHIYFLYDRGGYYFAIQHQPGEASLAELDFIRAISIRYDDIQSEVVEMILSEQVGRPVQLKER